MDCLKAADLALVVGFGVSQESIRPGGVPALGDEPSIGFVVRNVTSQVVHLQGGAHPSSSDPLYGFDVSHYKTYGGLIAEGGYAAWADAFLGASEADYQSKVGGLDAIHQLPLPAY